LAINQFDFFGDVYEWGFSKAQIYKIYFLQFEEELNPSTACNPLEN
jgi:hypothetical protein